MRGEAKEEKGGATVSDYHGSGKGKQNQEGENQLKEGANSKKAIGGGGGLII